MTTDDVDDSIALMPARSADVSHMYALQRLCYAETPHLLEDADFYRACVIVYPELCWVAKRACNGELIGYLIAHETMSGTDEPKLNEIPIPPSLSDVCIHDVAVHPVYRGIGVAKHLMKIFFRNLSPEIRTVCGVCDAGMEGCLKKIGARAVKPVSYGTLFVLTAPFAVAVNQRSQAERMECEFPF